MPTAEAYWTFDEGSGTVAADSTGNGHTAILDTGASWTDGNVGSGAVTLDGSGDGVVTASGPVVDTSGDFTVSAWVELDSLDGFQTVVSIAGSNVAGFFLQLRDDTGSFAFTRLSSDATGNATYVSAATAPEANTWYHLVGVNDATDGTISLYIDGQLIGTTDYTASWEATGDTLIGHGFYNGGNVDHVDGSIDDVQFFASALSAEQIAVLDQPAAYSFDDGTGTTAADISGHGNTMTLGSGASWAAGEVGSNSLALDGTTNGNATYASPVLDTTLPFSVSAWVKLDTLSGYQTFASIDGPQTSAFYLQYRDDTGTFAFTRLASDSNSAAAYHADATSVPSTGVWYNLIGVNDVAGGQLLLYVDGELQSTVSYSGGWQGTGATVVGGGLYDGARSDYVDGQVDDVRFYNAALGAPAAALIGSDGQTNIEILMGSTGVTVSPMLFGAFMEDINYGGEGGIYSNEIRNSGFNDSTNSLNAWAAVTGSGVVATLTSDTTTGPTSALTQSGKLTISSGVSRSSRVGISNSGYFGLAIAPSTTYTVDFYAKATSGFTGPLNVSLESTSGTVYAVTAVSSITNSWAKYSVTLTTDASTPVSDDNLFIISTSSSAANGESIWFGAAYMYPPGYAGYNGGDNHFRSDLAQYLVDMEPALFRVPGGNYLEGYTYADRFNWSETIGPVEDRPGHLNSAWGYWSTDGFGLDEYLQFAELMGAEPIVGVYAGYTLNGSSDTGEVLAADVVDAINELHYILDPVTTEWGALRAANGHPEPYDLNYVEVGNEDWFSSTYPARYPLFYDAIRAEFPDLKIIATSTATGGRPYDVLDDHFYNSSSWFLANSDYYDDATRGSYEIFVGEYAAREGNPTSTLIAALGDAAFLMGMMRNSDLVTMSAYAPLWVNVESYQWSTDLIGFDNTSSFGSASYYAQQILSLNHGETVISSTLDGISALQAIVTRTDTTYYLTVVNPLGTPTETTIDLIGVESVSPTGTATTLSASSAGAVNSISNPTSVAPVTSAVSGLDGSFTYTFAGYSLTVLEFTATIDTPTVVTPAAADPSTVTGTTTDLSVLGDDEIGEANLVYTWSVTGPDGVVFSDNGTNTAKNTTATFAAAGTYEFLATIENPISGATVTSPVTVTVEQVATDVVVIPDTVTVAAGARVQFIAAVGDQFGNPLSGPQPQFTWSVTSGTGSVNAAGLYTATTSAGFATVHADSVVGTADADVTVVAPVAWYEADASGGTTLTDSSGNGEDGTLNGSAGWADGVSGNALSLTGGYADLPSGIVSGLDDLTIATWVRLDSRDAWSRIFDFGTGTTVNMFLTPTAGSSSGPLRFALTTSGNNNEQQLNGPVLATDTWYHVAITLSGNTGTMYVNGEVAATNTSMTIDPADLGYTTQDYIGDSQYSGDPNLLSRIDDFRIYGAAMGAEQIAQLAKPIVVTPAATDEDPVTDMSASLSVLADDLTAGEAALEYTWSTTGTPPAAVAFSANGTNAAKNTTATFTEVGVYDLLVTIVNPDAGLTTTSAVTVNVGPLLPGDYNDDGLVNAADYTMWRDALGQTGVAPFSGADGNGDGTIDESDYGVWKSHYGQSLPASTATASAALVVTAEPAAELSEVVQLPAAQPVETALEPVADDADLIGLALLEDRAPRHESRARLHERRNALDAANSGDELLLALANDRVQRSMRRDAPASAHRWGDAHSDDAAELDSPLDDPLDVALAAWQ